MSLSKYTFRMAIPKHDITADKAFFANSLVEAMHQVREDILRVVTDVADKRKRGGDPNPDGHLGISDFNVELIDERPAHHKH